MEIPGYEITRCIGQGGMASAYLARQTSLDRPVVLKVLDSHHAESNTLVQRFLNEGRLIAALNHPHVITIYDINTAGSDVYIAMEYVEGGDLKERLAEQTLTPTQAIDIICKVASGLHAAHEKGIIHRDVKPANVLFRADGTPLLSDFGIAKDTTHDAELTAAGMFVGSPNYMSPEQAEAGAVDRRTDIYALGVIFFEMLTGHKPYVSESVVEVLMMHKKAKVPRLPAGLELYQEFIDLTLAKDRESRFRDAEALVNYLDRLSKKIAAQQLRQNEQPDFDVTGVGVSSSAQPAKRLVVNERKAVDRKPVLLLVLVIVGIANLVLAYFLSKSEEPRGPQVAEMNLESTAHLRTQSNAAGNDLASLRELPNRDEVLAAMHWLAQHSLNEYRLTTPPQDNAYYYYSRLLQLDANDAKAIAGMKMIAERYGVLADRAIADNDDDTARSFIAIGLQIDPDNQTLRSLSELAIPERNSFFAKLSKWF
ncbi:MAG: serine/threonine-protein kinase [Gammaproteobacteria bacterium]